MKIRKAKGGWRYTAGIGLSVVNGFHRDRETAVRIATAYEQRIGTSGVKRKHKSKSFSINTAARRGAA